MNRQVLHYSGYELILADIERADNCYLYDSRGQRYTDLESGVWCTSIGHCHPRVTAALREQAGKIIHAGFNYSNRQVDEAAREILASVSLTGGTCTLLTSGSEAINYAVLLAQAAIEKPLLLTFSKSYLGAFGSARLKAETEWHCFELEECLRCPQADTCDPTCPSLQRIPFDRIGGFVFEPGSSPGTIQFPPHALIYHLTEEVRRRNGLIICNEVTTGLGRTGKWYGYEHYGIEPDIVAIGKGLGNGYPVSATVFSEEVEERLTDKLPGYSQSHQNDPLGAVVAKEVIRILREEDLIERGSALGEHLIAELNELRRSSDTIKEVRGRGMMIVFELSDDEAQTRTTRVHEGLLRNHFVISRRPNLPVFRMDPALTIPELEIERFLRCLKELLQ